MNEILDSLSPFTSQYSCILAAGVIAVMEPLAARMGRLRSAAKAARRAQQRQCADEGPSPSATPSIIQFPIADPVERARRREAREIAQKREADRINAAQAVAASARDFIRAIRESVIMAAAYEKHGFDPADCSMRINPPTAEPLAGIDRRGRALVLCRQIDEPILEWVYLRRTRALALLTVRERAAFVNAVLDHPLVGLDGVCEACSLFERSLRAARTRDDAAMKVSAS
jgi:hypothetical protein